MLITKDEAVYNGLICENALTLLERGTNPIASLEATGIKRAAVVHHNDQDNMLTILGARKIVDSCPAVRTTKSLILACSQTSAAAIALQLLRP